jgi:hypothetical protein
MAAVLLSIGTVACIQWYQTGEPWGFVLAQQHWSHVLQVPVLPFNDPSGINVLWLDAFALWVGLVAVGSCCWLAWRWLQHLRRKQAMTIVPVEVVFSLGYCVCVALFIVLYQGGSLWNLGRYTLATPFFVVLVGYVAAQPPWPWQRYGWVALGTMLLWQVFGIYTQGFDNFTTPQALWYFFLLTCYLFAFLAWRQLRWQAEVTALLYVFNLVILLSLLEGWLQNYVVQ